MIKPDFWLLTTNEKEEPKPVGCSTWWKRWSWVGPRAGSSEGGSTGKRTSRYPWQEKRKEGTGHGHLPWHPCFDQKRELQEWNRCMQRASWRNISIIRASCHAEFKFIFRFIMEVYRGTGMWVFSTWHLGYNQVFKYVFLLIFKF